MINLFYVTSLDGAKVEALVNIGDDFRMEESVDGVLTASFTCLPSEYNPGYDILGPETVVTIEGYDFKVKQFNNSGYSKTVSAVSTFFEHSKTYIEAIFEGSHTLENHLGFIFPSTGWTYTIDDDIKSHISPINEFGKGNFIALLNKVTSYHQVEYLIKPNNHIIFSKLIGPDEDHQYRYGYNVSDVVLTEDSTNLFTYIKGYGKDGLVVEYLSPNHTIYGVKTHEPVRDERFTNEEMFINHLKTVIKDVPELVIESQIPEMTERKTGERIWLIYGPLELKVQTRILKQTKILVDGKLITDSVVFGNSLIKTSTDTVIDQQNQIDENKEYVDDTLKEIHYQFAETEERIISQHNTITSEYTAAITANAQVIRTEMGQKETNINNTIGAQYTKITSEYNSAITQTAQGIRTDVTAQINKVGKDILAVEQYASRIDQTASQIQSTVSSQAVSIANNATNISNAQSSITQQAGLISSKVSSTDFNGANIVSMINQTPSHIKIAAANVVLQGAVSVLSDISGNMGTITAGTLNLTSAIYVGNGVHLRGSGMTGVYFPSYSQIHDNSGALQIEASNGLTLVGASLDLSYIRGSINWGSHRPTAVWG